MNVADPLWEISEGTFLPFNVNESIISSEATGFITKIRELDISGSIYLRGSLIESKKPFSKSDIDVFLVCNPDINQEETFRRIRSITDRELDLKWVRYSDLRSDYVFYALLAHRSWHVSGFKIDFEPLRADKEFAWQHWVKYFPSGLPNEIDCSKRVSVIYFKLLIRCFGVILLLKDCLFTRDIDACITCSSSFDKSVYGQLCLLKSNIENSDAVNFNIKPVKSLLKDLFDNYF